MGQNLKKYQWKNRLVVVATEKDSHWQEQNQILKKCEKGLQERKVKVLRSNTTVEELFSVKLIGLDSGEKYRSMEPLTCEKLFALIDAMPMRKNELQRIK